jgi:Holliday junction resolvasome RuvABC endonuclease subunit
MEIILGLDVSTKTIGIGVLFVEDSKIKVEKISYYSHDKKDNQLQKLLKAKKFIISLLEQYKPTSVIIEDIVLFMQNKSQAKTIVPLAVMNRMVALTVLENTLKEPVFLNVLSIRHSLKDQITKILPEKEKVPERLEIILNIKFPFIYDKNGKIKEESYDAADGLAVATSYILLRAAKKLPSDKPPKKKKSTKTKEKKNKK